VQVGLIHSHDDDSSLNHVTANNWSATSDTVYRGVRSFTPPSCGPLLPRPSVSWATPKHKCNTLLGQRSNTV